MNSVKEKTDTNAAIINFFIVKSQLIILSSEELIEKYSNVGAYEILLSTVLGEINNAGLLVLYPEIREKVIDVISKYRFNFKNDELTELANNVLVGFNRIANKSDEALLDAKYEAISIEKTCRALPLFQEIYDDDIIKLIASDYTNYSGFLNGENYNTTSFYSTLTYVSALSYQNGDGDIIRQEINDFLAKSINDKNIQKEEKSIARRSLQKVKKYQKISKKTNQ